jgi:hypothetical protein
MRKIVQDEYSTTAQGIAPLTQSDYESWSLSGDLDYILREDRTAHVINPLLLA